MTAFPEENRAEGCAELVINANSHRRESGAFPCVVWANATLVWATCHVRLLRKALAVTFCDEIQAQARREGSTALVMNLASLSKATPPAGVYAMRALRDLPVRRIALVGGNGFMRAFARAVLTLGRFPDFNFFDDSGTAEAWAATP